VIDPENEGITILRSFGNFLSFYRA